MVARVAEKRGEMSSLLDEIRRRVREISALGIRARIRTSCPVESVERAKRRFLER